MWQPSLITQSLILLLLHFTVWEQKATNAKSIGYRLSAASTLLNHLVDCPYQPPSIKEKAQSDPSCTKSNSPSRRRRSSVASSTHGQNHPGMLLLPPNVQVGPGSHLGSPAISPLLLYQQLQGSRPASPATSLLPEDSASAASSNSSRSASALSTHYNIPLIHYPTPALASTEVPPFTDPTSLGQIWTTERQENFENSLARLTASAGLPLSWVDNPEWVALCQDFLPAAKSPSRKVLTSRITPRLINQLHKKSKEDVKGQSGTLQADGWTGENHRHIIAFMITANRKVSDYLIHHYRSDAGIIVRCTQ